MDYLGYCYKKLNHYYPAYKYDFSIYLKYTKNRRCCSLKMVMSMLAVRKVAYPRPSDSWDFFSGGGGAGGAAQSKLRCVRT